MLKREIKAVVEMRSAKSHEEIEEIEKAGEITRAINTKAMEMNKPRMKEREIAGIMEEFNAQMKAIKAIRN